MIVPGCRRRQIALAVEGGRKAAAIKPGARRLGLVEPAGEEVDRSH